MRLRLNLDKLEGVLNILRPRGNWLKWMTFPRIETSFDEVVSLAAVFRHSPRGLLMLAAFFTAFIVVFPLIVLAGILAYHNETHVHAVPWRLFFVFYRVLVRQTWYGGPPVGYALLFAGFSTANLLFLLALRWAWNRRADRLNRQPVLPEPVSAEMPGVWPPPPRTIP